MEDGDKLVWVCNLSPMSTRSAITMQPGKYRVIFRPINAKQSIYTKEKSFIIQSGQSTQVKL